MRAICTHARWVRVSIAPLFSPYLSLRGSLVLVRSRNAVLPMPRGIHPWRRRTRSGCALSHRDCAAVQRQTVATKKDQWQMGLRNMGWTSMPEMRWHISAALRLFVFQSVKNAVLRSQFGFECVFTFEVLHVWESVHVYRAQMTKMGFFPSPEDSRSEPPLYITGGQVSVGWRAMRVHLSVRLRVHLHLASVHWSSPHVTQLNYKTNETQENTTRWDHLDSEERSEEEWKQVCKSVRVCPCHHFEGPQHKHWRF